MVAYCVWKAKYKGLTPSEVRERRLRERRKRRVTTAAFAALVVISAGAASMLIGIPNASQTQRASANAPENPLKPRPAATSVPAPDLQSAAAAERVRRSPAVRQPSQEADATQPVGPRAGAMPANSEDIRTADPDGYLVQVAAVPDLAEARAVLEQLTESGYSAYLTAKIVDQVELYRVRVGPFKTRPVAEAAARRLEREGHRAPWVTK